MYNQHPLKPGTLEVYCGPMKSGKTLALSHRLDKLEYLTHCNVIIFNPGVNTRDSGLKSRFNDKTYKTISVDEKKPNTILEYMNRSVNVAVIDEAQFFVKGIEHAVYELLKNGVNVIAAGLDLDFRGEPFGEMPTLLAMANEVNKLTGICEYSNCDNLSTRTQRIIDGKPAHYDMPIISIEGKTYNEKWQTRCLTHHEVPR